MPERVVKGCMNLSFTKRRLREVRPDGPKPGDILLFCHARGLTRLVPWFTRSRYYHVAICEDDWHVVEARPNGVVRRDIKHEKDNVFRVIPMPENLGEIAIEEARRNLGCPYDVFDVVLIMLRRWVRRKIRHRDPHKFTCGEFITLAWRKAGIDLFPDMDAAMVIPADFAQFLPPDARDRVM